MFRNDLLKLSVTLVLLAATTFVSVAVVAAEGSDTIIQVKAASAAAALGGTADISDWYGRHPSPVKAGGAAVASDWFERHPSSILSGDAAAASDWFERHPSSILSGEAASAVTYYGPPGR